MVKFSYFFLDSGNQDDPKPLVPSCPTIELSRSSYLLYVFTLYAFSLEKQCTETSMLESRYLESLGFFFFVFEDRIMVLKLFGLRPPFILLKIIVDA